MFLIQSSFKNNTCKLSACSVCYPEGACNHYMYADTSTSQYILDDTIKVYGAVVSQRGKLFRSEDYTCFSNDSSVSE